MATETKKSMVQLETDLKSSFMNKMTQLQQQINGNAERVCYINGIYKTRNKISSSVFLNIYFSLVLVLGSLYTLNFFLF